MYGRHRRAICTRASPDDNTPAGVDGASPSEAEAVEDGEIVQESSGLSLASLVLPAWAACMGGFLVYNYYFATAPWPPGLGAVPLGVWSLLHAISGAAFSGGILTTTFLEWVVVTQGNADVKRFWYNAATRAEHVLVLPGLTGSLISGVAQAWLMYQRPLQYAPLHVKLPIHVLVLFGLWWLMTDLNQRHAAEDNNMQAGRLRSNAVSCALVLLIYGIMVLKPGA